MKLIYEANGIRVEKLYALRYLIMLVFRERELLKFN